MMAQAIYIRIADDLRQRILNGEYRTDDSLPSENELAAAYGTSRVTVRKSLNLLENEGLIRARRGKGYFVQPPRHAQYTMFFVDSRREERFRYQEVNIVTPGREVTEALHLRDGQPVIVARRIQERESRIVAYDEKYIPYERGVPSIEFELQFSEFPDMFAARFTSLSLHTEMSIALEAPPLHVSKLLCPETCSPLLVVNRLIVTAEDQPIGYGKKYLSSDYGPLTAVSGNYSIRG